MKRNRLDINKKIVKKTIELKHSRPNINKMNERNKLRTSGIPKPITNSLASRSEIRRGVNLQQQIGFKDYCEFSKKEYVDFDVIVCVSSFERYEKILRMIEQFFSQETKYSFKFILLDDGSKDKRYDELQYLFPDIIYLKNDIAGGKINYWNTVNCMWKKASEFKSYGIIQLDDDFILCDKFLDILLDEFFEVKEKSNNYMVFSFHLYNFKKNTPIEQFWFEEKEIFVDGGMLLDTQFLEQFNYELDKIEERVTLKTSSYTWVRLKERMIEFGIRIHRFKNSLVWHDGNDDSKLHPNVRTIKRVYTKNFIDKGVNYEQ